MFPDRRTSPKSWLSSFQKIVFCFLISSPCFPADWRDTGVKASNTQHIYVNHENMKRDADGNEQFWVKQLYKLKNPKSLTEKSYSLQFWTVSCYQRDITISQFLNYNQKGDIVKTLEEIVFKMNVPPDSVGEGILDYVCKPLCKNVKELWENGLMSLTEKRRICGEN